MTPSSLPSLPDAAGPLAGGARAGEGGRVANAAHPQARRLLPAVLSLVGILVAVGALLLFARADALRGAEERATGAMAGVVDAIGLQAALAKDVALRAAALPAVEDRGAALGALARALAVQAEALAVLRVRLEAMPDRDALDPAFAEFVFLVERVEATAGAVARGEVALAPLVETTDAILAATVALATEVGAATQGEQVRGHAEQAMLEAAAAALLGCLILFGLFPALFVLHRQNRELRSASSELEAAAEELTVMSRMVQVAPWHIECSSGDVRWSPRLRDVLRIPDDVPETLAGTLALFEPASAARLEALVARTRETGEGWDVELTTIAETGGRRMRCFGQAIREDGRGDGPVAAIASAVQDVTDGALARERYEAAQQRLAIATEGANIGLWDWAPGGDENWYNDSWWTMLGYEPGGVPDAAAAWGTLVHPDDRAHARERFELHMRGEAPDYRAEFRMRAADGGWRWILAVGRVVARAPDGAPARLSGLHLDITERREAEAALAESEERFRSLTAMGSDWFWEQDADLRFTHFSQEINGFWKDRAELIGKSRRELPIVLENTTWEEHLAVLARREPFRDLEYRVEDGAVTRWFRVSGDPVFGPDGEFRGYRGVGTDVSERRLAMAQLVDASGEASERARELQLTLAHMIQGLTMYDAAGRLVIWNDRYLELMELAPGSLRYGMHLTEVLELRRAAGSFGGDIARAVPAFLERVAAGEETRATVRTRGGRLIAQSNAPIPGGGWVTTHEDVTEREQVAARISHAAHHDVLTGLANRASLKAHIDETLHAPCASPFGVLLIDLDRFKAVNDTFGHAIGDALLVEVAERMHAHVRQEDVVARLGGDEFAVLARGRGREQGDEREACEALARRLLETLIEPFSIDGRQIVIGASIGVALAPAHGREVDELLRNADTALYRVKADGRNGWRIFDGDLDAAARARRELTRDLREAMGRDQLSLHFQPIVDIASREAVGVETLLRWHHPERGMVSPAVFIPLLEETGLITPVGDWVIHQACREARALPEHVSLAVNVSPAQLRNRGLLDVVLSALEETGLAPERLELEVTETVLLDDDQALLADLRRVKALGVRISLDDFGTGYSSLSYLRMFPFDKIKIDKSFVNDFVEREDCAAIVCSIIALARSLDMVCTAEGVETETQATMLRAAGCDLAQGYLFSRPMPLAELDLGPAAVEAAEDAAPAPRRIA
ncbi:sensor domain-containing protein [Salinarimonas rosea]|uniref:sensor domain-containing protein n=1 Tax=Salinarimonas rosea TaxID=552063 RepID=UPI0006944F9F|nr:EAL domain-containing protein [Salinarimonas rosea]